MLCALEVWGEEVCVKNSNALHRTSVGVLALFVSDLAERYSFD
jgi:hypothetical protein